MNRFVTRIMRRVPHVELQELFTLPEHMSSSLVFTRFVLLNLSLFLCSVLWVMVCSFICFTLFFHVFQIFLEKCHSCFVL